MVKSSPTTYNIDKYKIIRAKARRTIKTARRESWQRFVSTINNRTSLKKVWSIINKISGKRSATEVKHLQVGNESITSAADIADALADSFSEISSTNHCNNKILTHKNNIQRYP